MNNFVLSEFAIDHRHSSHHIHHPLSKLPGDGRRKKGGHKRRKSSGRDHKVNSGPSSPLAIEEDEDEEEEEEATDGQSTLTVSPTEAESKDNVQVIVFI